MALLDCFPEIHLHLSMHYCPNGAFPYAGETFDFDDFVAKDSFEVGSKSLAKSGVNKHGFGWSFGVDPKFVRTTGEGPIYMGEHPNVK